MGLFKKTYLGYASALVMLLAACSPQASGSPEAAASPKPPSASVAAQAPTTIPLPRADSPLADSISLAEGSAEVGGRYRVYTPAGQPPLVDKSLASVSLDDVVFDTFRGDYIPLSKASDALAQVLRDVIAPIYEPKYDPADEAYWLHDSDIVIGYTSGSEAFAYPIKMLDLHEIVNDVIDGVPVLVTYCPLCGTGVVFSREWQGPRPGLWQHQRAV